MDVLRNKMASLAPHVKKHKVTVVGSGNWGSVIAKVIAENVAAHSDIFEQQVQMWVYEEEITLPQDSKHYDASSSICTEKQPLTKLINHFHENVKYLPGIALPKNIVANPSLTESVKDSTILIFNLPHQFIAGICKQLKGHIVPFARGVSCIKGVDVADNKVGLFSESIGAQLGIYCGALSGANIANEVAQEKYSETTIAYDPPPMDSQAPTPAQSAEPSPTSSQMDLTQAVHKDASGRESKVRLKALPSDYHPIDHSTWKTLFHRPYFHVRVISDVAGVSLGGALKNIVAVAAGFVDGLGWGDNAKAAIMRVGLLEMVKFGQTFFGNTINVATFTEESAGVADLITTCSGGRNHRCAKLSVERGISIEEVEAQELNGQKIQGTLTAVEVNRFLKSQGMEKDFPLFTAVYEILQGKVKPQDIPSLIEPSSENLPNPGSSNRDNKNHQPTESVTFPAALATTGAMQSSVAPDKGGKPNRQGGTSSTTQSIPQKRKALHTSIRPAHPLNSSRYHRQLLLPSISIRGHTLLSSARVLIIGLGGLGCPASLYLAAAGIGKLGVLDSDTVELSNLHRQVMHREDSVGWTKVKSAIRGLRDVNSELEYVGYEEAFTPSNAVEIAKEYDLILDCTDNPQTRYLINDVAVALNRTVVSAAAQRMEGQCMLLNHPVGQGPCYRCIFPRSPKADTVVSCEEVGVLGTAVGTMGVIMAGEAIRVIAQEHTQERRPGMLIYNAWADTMFRSIRLRGKRKGCIACGNVEDIKAGESKITADAIQSGLVDYVAFCGTREDVHVLNDDERISPTNFLHQSAKQDGESVVIDVREPHEFALGAQVKNSINIPISTILQTMSSSALPPIPPSSSLSQQEDEPGGARSLVFICQQGNDSQIAAQKYKESSSDASNRWDWIGDVAGGIDAVLREGQRDV